MRDGTIRRTLLLEILGDRLTRPRSVIDLGGGTGSLAAALAAAGHTVTVVDPSPDSLAAVQRRAAEAGLQDRLFARQGDASTLDAELATESVDLVLCHDVIEFVEDPAGAFAAMARVLRPSGQVSLLIAQRYPQAIARAAAGEFLAARQAYTTPILPDPALIEAELIRVGLSIRARHGLGLAAGSVVERVSEGRRDDLLSLERAFLNDQGLLASAPRLHLLAGR